MAHWKISVLGSSTVESTQGRRIKLSGNTWALIAFLLVAPGRSTSRGRISAGLWPDLDEAAARHCLATTLWRAKKAFRPDPCPLLVEEDEITLELGGRVWVDAIAFDRRLRPVVEASDALSEKYKRPRIRRVVDTYGEFAVDLEAEWAAIERERLRALHLDALFLLAASYGRAADWLSTVVIARRLCAAEPLREDAQRLLMIALEKTGNRALALKQYEKCRALLASELSVEPMTETSALYRQLAGTPEAARAEPGKLRPAVLAAKRSVGEALHTLDSALEIS